MVDVMYEETDFMPPHLNSVRLDMTILPLSLSLYQHVCSATPYTPPTHMPIHKNTHTKMSLPTHSKHKHSLTMISQQDARPGNKVCYFFSTTSPPLLKE